jgi:hypothetical protein
LRSNFAEFGEVETMSAERRPLLRLFEQVWQNQGQIIAVKPRSSSLL